MVYQHPLAYLLGLEGIALLRAWAGDFDEAFVHRRLDEIRRLLATGALADHDGVTVRRGDTLTGYRRWAATYDEPRNGLFDIDEPVMHRILDAMPPGDALDAACGTGRYAEHLAGRGHRVVGVDSSPDMLDRARTRVPSGTFLCGDLHQLPLPDRSVDLVVSGLALTHVPTLRGARGIRRRRGAGSAASGRVDAGRLGGVAVVADSARPGGRARRVVHAGRHRLRVPAPRTGVSSVG